MSENQRPPRADIVDIAVAIHVNQGGSLAVVDEERVASTERNARTGLFTPPGITSWARRKSSRELWMLRAIFLP